MQKDYLEEMVNMDDFESLYLLKCQKDAVQWSGFESKPDKEHYKEFIQEKVIADPKNHLFLFKDGKTNDVMGYVQFVDEGNGIGEGRGSGLIKRYQGCGLASVLDQLYVEKAREYNMKYLYAWCSEKNIVSMNALIDAGFQKTDIKEIRHMKVFNEDHIFFKWEIYL